MLGEAEVIASIPIPDIDAYHRARYTGANVVVGAAGHLDHERIVELAERLVSPGTGENGGLTGAGRPEETARLRFYEKDTEQYHICFGAPGITRDDERRYGLAVLDSIFGGSTSSRLFREVREKRGLAYSVGSYNEQYTDSGLVATYVGTREDNVEEACAIIGAELERLRTEPVSGEELARAKENVKGRLVLSSESTAARMTRISRATLFDLPIDSLDEMLAKVDAVEVDDLTELAAELYGAERLSAACVGRGEDCFREALAPVSESLVAGDDPRRRLRGRGADGAGRLRGGRGRRGHGAGRPGPTRRSASSSPTSLDDADVVVDFTTPETAVANVRACLEAGVHAVVGTTGFDLEELREAAESAPARRQLLRRPQLRDRRRAADGGRAADRAAHARVRDRRAPPRQEARRARRGPRSAPRS